MTAPPWPLLLAALGYAALACVAVDVWGITSGRWDAWGS